MRMWYFRPILDAAIKDTQDGAKTGKDYSPYSFMKEGGNDIVFTESMVMTDAVPAMEAKRKAVKAGEFTVPVDSGRADLRRAAGPASSRTLHLSLRERSTHRRCGGKGLRTCRRRP